VYVELYPGDALFSSIVVSSTQVIKTDVTGDNGYFLIAFNRADNNPYFARHCPQYTKLHKVLKIRFVNCINFTIADVRFGYNGLFMYH